MKVNRRIIMMITSVSFFLLVSGCLEPSARFQVYSYKINNHTYQWGQYERRVIGVFKDTEINRKKVKQAINNTFLKLISYNNLRKRNRLYSYDEQAKICEQKVRAGIYGYYKNAYEKQKLMLICMNNMKDSHSCWTGKKFFPDKKNWKIIDITTDNCKKSYNTIRIGYLVDRGNLIIYIAGKPKDGKSASDFIYINNLLLDELKKENLETDPSIIHIDIHHL